MNDFIAGLGKAWMPHLRIFLSADIIGSTAYKQDTRSKTDSWLPAVLQFYKFAQYSLAECWARAGQSMSPVERERLLGKPPELWKTIGDEVVFTKRVENPDQALRCVQIWMQTIEEIRQLLKEKRKLDVKSTAWVADFPMRNSEIVLPRLSGSDTNDGIQEEFDLTENWEALEQYHTQRDAGEKRPDLIRDFIGPSIDTGFRLGAFASAQKLVISIELTYLLAREIVHGHKNIGGIRQNTVPAFTFRYDGQHPMKGVLGGSPYPIFWIDLQPNNPLHNAESSLLGKKVPTHLEVETFCIHFMEKYGDDHLLCSLFMQQNPVLSAEFRTVPPHVIDNIRRHAEASAAARSNLTSRNVDLSITEIVADGHDAPSEIVLPVRSEATARAELVTAKTLFDVNVGGDCEAG